MNNTDYRDALSQIYTRYTPILSFIKAIHFQNNRRWMNLTRNIELGIKTNIEKIQQNIDLKNALLILNLLPKFQNEQEINLESLFTNLSFGGTISYYNWIEISNNLSFSNILGKTVFLAPMNHKILLNIQPNLEPEKLNLLTLKTITEITFKENSEKILNETLELLAFDVNFNLLRFLIRYKDSLANQEVFQQFKAILSNWKTNKNFIGSIIFDFDSFDLAILLGVFKKLQTLNLKYNLNLPNIQADNIEKLTRENYEDFENLLVNAKMFYLKRISLSENQIAKVFYILSLLTVETENLSWIVFGKAHGLENEIITKRLFVI